MTADSLFDVELVNLEIPTPIKQRLDDLRNSEYFEFFDPAGFTALCRLIGYAIRNGWSNEHMIKFFFNPIIPSTAHIDIFRRRHQQMYREQSNELANIVDNSPEQFFAISSSMYAGKSTLAVEVCEQLAAIGYKVIPLVPFFMSDEDNANFITLRGREAREGDIVGNDGFTRIKAFPYNPDNYIDLIESLGINDDEKTVIHFDEFSFLSEQSILDFVQYLTVNYSNVKVLFVGLNRNALGSELPGYTAILPYVSNEFLCKSFVPNAIDIVDDSTEPTGTYTSRYVVLPGGLTVLDCGFLPIAVPKEYSELVHYTPSNESQHMYVILKQMGSAAILETVVNPNESQLALRNALFDKLKPSPIES